MSVFGDKVRSFFRMDNMYEDEFDDDYDDYDSFDPENSREAKNRRTSRRNSSSDNSFTSDFDSDTSNEDSDIPPKSGRSGRRPGRQSKVVQMNGDRGRASRAQIHTFKPSSMDDSKDIVNALLAGKAVILNFVGTNADLAQRIIDSIGGACCAIDGTIKQIASYIFVVVPVGISLEGDYSDTASTSNPYDFKGNRYQY